MRVRVVDYDYFITILYKFNQREIKDFLTTRDDIRALRVVIQSLYYEYRKTKDLFKTCMLLKTIIEPIKRILIKGSGELSRIYEYWC